jgi:hypothetical protein
MLEIWMGGWEARNLTMRIRRVAEDKRFKGPFWGLITLSVKSSGWGPLWLLSHDPQIPEAEYAELTRRAGELGYDTALLRRVPQRGSAAAGAAE